MGISQYESAVLRLFKERLEKLTGVSFVVYGRKPGNEAKPGGTT